MNGTKSTPSNSDPLISADLIGHIRPRITENTHAPPTDPAVLQRINIRRAQNTVLIWLDNHIDEDSLEYENTVTRLQLVVNDVETFKSDNLCIEFLQGLENSKACMIIEGTLSQHVVSQVHDLTQVDSIFIFSDDQKRLKHWAEQWPKIKGICADIVLISKMIKQIAQQVEHNAMSMSFVSSDKRLDQLNPTFMYIQIIKEIILTIEFDSTYRRNYIEFCREIFTGNKAESSCVNEFERTYKKEKAVWWYTYQCFLYPMLNKALQAMDGDMIIKMGFFIKDLHQQIEQLYLDQFVYQTSPKTFTVFRGQGISQVDFEQMLQSKGGLISFNNFLSTSYNRETAINFAPSVRTSSGKVGILFVMEINPVRSNTPFASIASVSAHAKEDEVLFSMNAVFRIKDIQEMSDDSHLYEVHLSLTSDNDPELFELACYIRRESLPGNEPWYRLGALLLRMGQAEKAEEIYEDLLKQKSDDNEKASIYDRLSLAKYGQGKYQDTIEICKKLISIYQKNSSAESVSLANLYNRMGSAYLRIGNYSNALKVHQDALRILKQAIGSSHPEIAKSYNNIGMALYNMSEYAKALQSHQKAVEINEELLPSNHPDLASTYNNIGSVYQSMGEFEKALAYYEKDLSICQQSLPPNHPDLASTYNNIGSAHQSMGDYAKALSYYEKDLAICQQSLSSNHPDLAKSLNNIGSVHRHMGEYTIALTYHERALKIYEQALNADHPDFASCYNYIGNVFRSIGDFQKALSYYQKALLIIEQSLLPNHPDLASSHNNIGNVYCSMGKHDKALLSHEKALAIRQQSFPPNHPDIACSYTNIASVYETMRDYTKARLFYERALRVAEHSPCIKQENLQVYKDNLARAKRKA
ncbi:unnamed protein product [Adineta ricciae]|uniref:ADP ribosyltransferase domain-containing protein n=1 Tax=Adineta ricciae TaxID=249248 RepID=A0A815MG40_ADIRI|nr:unnamed protein product [Adineta ricciae]CAF1578851.1 unnamed protein product [Adineta ricciae]